MSWNKNGFNGSRNKSRSRKVSSVDRAFYSGMGYAVASRGRDINFKSKRNANAFARGINYGSSLLGKESSYKYPFVINKKK